MSAKEGKRTKESGTGDGSANAAGETTTIEFRGEKFSFPSHRGMWPTVAMQAFQNGRWADGVEQLFGPAQWRRLNAIAPTVQDFWEFFPVFAEAAGVVKPDDSADKDD